MNRDEVHTQVERYLARQQCVLWGKHYDIVAQDSRIEAIEFLTNAIMDVFNPPGEPLSYSEARRREYLLDQGADEASAADQFSEGPVRAWGPPSWPNRTT